MNKYGISLPRVAITVVVLLLGMLWSGVMVSGPTPSRSFVTSALAWIGRPATPVSYAGVARRTTRRMYYATAPYRYP